MNKCLIITLRLVMGVLKPLPSIKKWKKAYVNVLRIDIQYDDILLKF
jgi:hypothetical protein